MILGKSIGKTWKINGFVWEDGEHYLKGNIPSWNMTSLETKLWFVSISRNLYAFIPCGYLMKTHALAQWSNLCLWEWSVDAKGKQPKFQSYE